MSTLDSPKRWSIKDPIPEIYAAWSALNGAVDAHLAGDRALAEALFREANSQTIWNWTNPDWGRPDLNVRNPKPLEDTAWVPKSLRDPARDPSPEVKSAAIARDGYRCRYCGIPVVAIRAFAPQFRASGTDWNAFAQGK